MGKIQPMLSEVMLQVRHLLEQLVTNDANGLCTF
jgi:5'-methylthioadenosine phosphorylase